MCSRKDQSESDRLSYEYVRNYIKENGNGDFLISEKYEGKRKLLSIWCHKHNGIYLMSWDNFHYGKGCAFCWNQIKGKKHSLSYRSDKRNLLLEFPEISKDWDYNKNQDIPENFASQSNYLIYWICPECKISYQSTIVRRTLYKIACPVCYKNYNRSRGEIAISNWLEFNNFLFDEEKRFEDCRDIYPLPFDFIVYVRDYFCLIEFQGKQHYEPVDFFNKSNSENRIIIFEKNRGHDIIKQEYCSNKKIPLIIISYKELKQIEQILEKELSPLLKEVIY